MKKALIILTLFVTSCTYVTVEPNKVEPNEPISELVLESFTVDNKIPNSVDLKWVTIKEIKAINFEIEYSRNNIDWVNISKVNAENKPNTYNFVHSNINHNSRCYYRLKSNYEGGFEYSGVKMIIVEGIWL